MAKQDIDTTSLDNFFETKETPKVLKVHVSDNACVSCEG